MTMSALKAHPKVYWIWNHRRWCLENIPRGPEQEGERAFHSWRQAAWDKELSVVEKMLAIDPRNCESPSMNILSIQLIKLCSLVHAWDYRRYILSGMPTPRPESSELLYTSKKIEANFSNFSAWHQRSKTLAFLWAQGKLDEKQSRQEGMSHAIFLHPLRRRYCLTEFELLRNAMYTDPNDQSVWMYHRWLVGTGNPISPMT